MSKETEAAAALQARIADLEQQLRQLGQETPNLPETHQHLGEALAAGKARLAAVLGSALSAMAAEAPSGHLDLRRVTLFDLLEQAGKATGRRGSAGPLEVLSLLVAAPLAEALSKALSGLPSGCFGQRGLKGAEQSTFKRQEELERTVSEYYRLQAGVDLASSQQRREREQQRLAASEQLAGEAVRVMREQGIPFSEAMQRVRQERPELLEAAQARK